MGYNLTLHSVPRFLSSLQLAARLRLRLGRRKYNLSYHGSGVVLWASKWVFTRTSVFINVRVFPFTKW